MIGGWTIVQMYIFLNVEMFQPYSLFCRRNNWLDYDYLDYFGGDWEDGGRQFLTGVETRMIPDPQDSEVILEEPDYDCNRKLTQVQDLILSEVGRICYIMIQ